MSKKPPRATLNALDIWHKKGDKTTTSDGFIDIEILSMDFISITRGIKNVWRLSFAVPF